MKSKNRSTVITVAVVFLLFFTAYAGIKAYSGHEYPLSTVVSKSMQHDDNQSQLGVLDTGDMVLVRDKSKVRIVSYLEGRDTDYSKFGDYGSVIVYWRGDGKNPVIHRALMYVEVVPDGLNKAVKVHHLNKYTDDSGTPMWSCDTGATDPDALTGILTLFDVGHKNRNVTVDLDRIISDNDVETAGYVTKGDNNNYVDQPGLSPLVTYDMIKSVPVAEIPWLGCLKMIFNGKKSTVDENVPNSLPSLGISLLAILVSIFLIDVASEFRKKKSASGFPDGEDEDSEPDPSVGYDDERQPVQDDAVQRDENHRETSFTVREKPSEKE